MIKQCRLLHNAHFVNMSLQNNLLNDDIPDTGGFE